MKAIKHVYPATTPVNHDNDWHSKTCVEVEEVVHIGDNQALPSGT